MDDTTQPIGPPPPAPRLPDDPPPAARSPVDPPSVALASRLLRMVLVGAGGLVLLVVGLAWDAVLHARDPGLAAEEGVFALSNPGHLLAGVGIALVAVGLAGALATLVLDARGDRPLSTPARVGLAGAAVTLALVAGGTGVWAASAGGHPGHDQLTAAQGDGHAGHEPAATATAQDPIAGGATAAGAGGQAGPGEHAHGPNLPDVAAATD